MSYINEALKKAQRDRDSRRIRYLRSTKPAWQDKVGIPNKIIWGSLLLLIFLGLGFVTYLWFDGPFEESPKSMENKALQDGIPTSGKTIHPEGVQTGLKGQKVEEISTLSKMGVSPNMVRLYSRAKDLYKGGRLLDSEKVYKDVLRLAPEFPDALNDLGVLYIRTRNFDGAKECFEKVIQIEPDLVEPYYNLACLHSVKGEVKEGLEQLSQAVRLNPSVKAWAEEDPDLLNLRGVPDFKDVIKD
ncbi:MAG: tetratricopeptide repeat protein [Deltaproteobacteria bacterium]|nr:tetratricopeptide repeat protein [Deltaproteobacteria bacterium]